MSARIWQRIEGGLVFLPCLLAIAAFAILTPGLPVWSMVLLFFAPDAGMLGYLAGPKVGAALYNGLHLYSTGLLLAILGFGGFGNSALVVIGLLWMAHVGFDRMLGYGLKEITGFADTHLGRIGRGKGSSATRRRPFPDHTCFNGQVLIPRIE